MDYDSLRLRSKSAGTVNFFTSHSGEVGEEAIVLKRECVCVRARDGWMDIYKEINKIIQVGKRTDEYTDQWMLI